MEEVELWKTSSSSRVDSLVNYPASTITHERPQPEPHAPNFWENIIQVATYFPTHSANINKPTVDNFFSQSNADTKRAL